MKLSCLMLIGLLAISSAACAVEDRPAALRAIARVENSTTVGAHGETGPYQMTPRTRKDFGGDSYAAAMRRLRWTEQQLRAHDIDPNIFNVALCWNAGVACVLRGNATIASYNYAVRVRNVYEQLLP